MPTRGVAYGLLRSDKLFSEEEPEGASIGKYPYMTWVNRYIRVLRGTYAESTLYDMERHYRRMHRELLKLVETRKIGTANPQHMTMKDVERIIVHYKNLGLSPRTINRDFSALNSLLLFTGNPSFVMYKLRNPNLFPATTGPRQPPLERDFVLSLLERANRVEDSDWKRLRAYALVLFAIGTGARNKELRFVQLTDLNIDEGLVHLERVKGEGKWGEPRDVPLRPQIRPILRRYLNARAKELARAKRSSTALFPSLNDNDGHLSANMVRTIKTVVERDMGRSFDVRCCRRTFGQLMLDEGISIESVSVVMGHKTSRTTEQYYARRKQRTAIDEARRTWNVDQPPAPRRTSIRFDGYNSGYA